MRFKEDKIQLFRPFMFVLPLIFSALFLCSCGSDKEENQFVHKPLPFELEALEPYISKETLYLHHGRHHAGYVTKTNQLLKKHDLTMKCPATLLKKISGKEKYQSLFNSLGQALNHRFFWECLKPGGGGTPPEKLLTKINESFGSFEAFKQAFLDASASQFGSGWVWLVKEGDKLEIMTTSNADTPVAHGKKPIFVVDVWEHAYYLDYQNKRTEFVKMVLEKLANWEFAQKKLEE